MKTTWGLRVWAVCVVLLFAIGCRTNLLPEYAGRITSTRAEVRVPTNGTVNVRTGPADSKKPQSTVEKITNTTVGIMAANAAVKAERKLQEAVPPERVQTIIAKQMAAAAPTVGFPFVSPADPSNSQLTVTVRRYGIQADGDRSPASARFEMYASLIFLPESKLIWEYTVYIDIPLASVHVASAQSSIAGDVSNVVAIAELERKDLRRLFTSATRMATKKFMAKLSDEYRQGLAVYTAKHGEAAKPAPPVAPPPEKDDDEEEDAPAAPAPTAPAPEQKAPEQPPQQIDI
jgi:hypothetical protein